MHRRLACRQAPLLPLPPSAAVLTFLQNLFHRPPTADKFADMVLDALRRAWPEHTFTLDRERFQIRQSDGLLINLHNIFTDYRRADPAMRQQQLDRFVRGMVSAGSSEDVYEEIKDRLLPVLRNLSGVDLMRIDAGDEKALSDIMCFRPLSDDLGIALAIDSELNIKQIGDDALKRWNKTFDEVLLVAVDNLRHQAAPAFHEISRGLFASHYGDYYDAARILVHELIWQLPVGAQPVAMVPNRSCLLVCGADNEAALIEMVGQARLILFEESRPLSADMFLLTDNTWAPWTPPGEPGRALGRLQRELLASGYAEQKQAMDIAQEQAGTDVFVATHTLVERSADGQLISYAVLPRDVHTWLPTADLVLLSEGEGADPLIVTMADFLEIAGSGAQRLPYVLPRYEVVEFPDAGCMERLRARATSMDAVDV